VWQAAGVGLLLLIAVGPAPAQEPLGSPGVVVRKIVVDRQPIFDEKDEERIRFLPLSWVNRLHVTTQQSVIRSELLFDEGELLDPEQLQESERKLRGLGIFADVVVSAVPAAGDSVDVVVITKEVWTTAVDFGYESFEDERLVSLSVSERNLFGTARRVNFSIDSGVDRSSWSVGLRDPQLFDGTWNSSMFYRDADDGQSWGASIGRPYFSLTDDQTFGLRFSSQEYSPRFYVSATDWVRPDGRFEDLEVFKGWKLGSTPRRVYRWETGFLWERQDLSSELSLERQAPAGSTGRFEAFPDEPNENHSWRTVFVGVSQTTRRYDELRFVRGMGRVEDIPIGPRASLRLGWTTRALGSTESGVWVDGRLAWSLRRGRSWLHTFSGSATGLVSSGGGRDLRLVLSARGLHTIGNGVIFTTGMRFGAISEADRHQVLSLGLDSGLRASRFREFNGDRLVRANAELRFMYTPGILDLVIPGVTIFADAGSSWFENVTDFQPSILRGAYGIGFRMGFLRSADELPLRVDFAWPALYDPEASRTSPVVSIGTGQVF